MAEQGLLTPKVWLAQYELQGYLNSLGFGRGVEGLDNTKFGDDTRSHAAGLHTVRMEMAGLFDSDVDEALESKIAVVDVPISIGVQAGAVGEVARTFLGMEATYTPGAAVGEMLRFDASALSRGVPCVRGTILQVGTQAASDTGTAYQLGAIAADEKMYAALHVVTDNGTTLDVDIESDDAEEFTDPTTRISFTQASGLTSEWKSLAGAVTDDWWRVNFTIVGTSWAFTVVAGIK